MAVKIWLMEHNLSIDWLAEQKNPSQLVKGTKLAFVCGQLPFSLLIKNEKHFSSLTNIERQLPFCLSKMRAISFLFRYPNLKGRVPSQIRVKLIN